MYRVSTVLFLGMLLALAPTVLAASEDYLVGHWSFDEGSGTVVADASGSGNDGELVGDASWVAGKFGQALDFGAGGGYVLVPDDDALDLSDELTYMGWMNLNQAIEGQRRMMSKNNSVFFLFDFGDDPTSLDFLVKPGNDFTETTTVDWVLGQWYHFAGTYDGDALRIYIDGVMEGETTGVPPIAASDLDLWIGADDHNPPTTTFPGVLDDIRIYNKALNADEIAALMASPTAVEPGANQLTTTWALLRSQI